MKMMILRLGFMLGSLPHRFKQIRSGAIDLHDAFSEVEDGIIFQIKVPHDEQMPLSMPILQRPKFRTICCLYPVNS